MPRVPSNLRDAVQRKQIRVSPPNSALAPPAVRISVLLQLRFYNFASRRELLCDEARQTRRMYDGIKRSGSERGLDEVLALQTWKWVVSTRSRTVERLAEEEERDGESKRTELGWTTWPVRISDVAQ